MRKCLKCNTEKTELDFYKNKTTKDGIDVYCKECRKKDRKEYYKNNKEKELKKIKINYKKNRKKILEKSKIYRLNNKSYIKKYDKDYYKNHSQKIKEQTKLYYENNKEECIIRNELWKEKHPEKVKEIKTNWKKNNPEKVRASSKNDGHKRRARCRETDVTTDFLIQLEENTKYCPTCGIIMNRINYHPAQKTIDHIILLSLGGKHMKNNIRCICRRCNGKRPKDGRDISKVILEVEI
jgi:HNH endonuclease